MSAGPYPTKTMFEALQGRVRALETAVPGGASGPAYLSDRVLLDTTGTRPIPPAEIPNELYVRACTLTFSPDAEPLTFSVLEGGLKQWGAGLYVTVAASTQKLGQGELLFSGHTDDDYRVVAPKPVTIPPGGVLVVAYEKPFDQYDGKFRADPVLPPGVSYIVDATDSSGTPLSAPLAALPFSLLAPRTVLGSLAPDAMNVVKTPSALAKGGFEIVDPADGAPYLRYRSSNGGVYNLPMAPESA